MRRVATPILLLLAGCASEPEVELAATRLNEAEWRSWSRPGVESAHRHITIRRAIRTPACRHLDAQVVRTGRELTLRVAATPVDPPCAASDTLWGYMAVIQNLDPGQYRLSVLHSFPSDAMRPETVLRHQVIVE